ncbi:hypothetical protein GCWU000324_03215 [Kingella oralis ATCC 51147]|uniref:Uncharacterized protein n=1 Tax=Kingella oralis ATCC 51147 TaxID=629741 RepID=C4GNC6_9NEIS|nr:hypothetical protein GCWU000324_03215 [Kingella oralis ATCC 51147]
MSGRFFFFCCSFAAFGGNHNALGASKRFTFFAIRLSCHS